MFDPERDDDPGARPFYTRLLAVAVVAAAACVALWPSVTGIPSMPAGSSTLGKHSREVVDDPKNQFR